MNRLLFLLFLLLCSASIQAQNDHCDKFEGLLDRAKTLWTHKKFDDAFAKLSAAREACPDRAAEVDKRYAAFIRDIAGKYEMADRKTREAIEAKAVAEQESKKAEREKANAEENAKRAYSTYANYIALESQTALRNGDRNTAFRLAEFAHRYVDNNNPNITRSLIQALYYNESPDVAHRLPWVTDLTGHSQNVLTVAFSPDGKSLAVGTADNAVKIWDLESGKATFTFQEPGDYITCLAFSPDGKRFASAYIGARVWDLTTGKTMFTFKGHTQSISDLAFSPDGNSLAIASRDSTVKIWDLNSGKNLLSLKGHDSWISSVAFSPNGKMLATGSEDNNAKIWDLQTGKDSMTLKGHAGPVLCLAFSPDGTLLATGSADNTAKLWDLQTGKSFFDMTGHLYWVIDIAFSPDGRKIATGSLDNTAKIWDIDARTNFLTLKGHFGQVHSIAFSPDGQTLATGSFDQTVKIWNLDGNKDIFLLGKHSDRINGIAFSPDGQRFASVAADTAKIWDLESGKNILRIAGHANLITSVAISSDGKRLATGSADFTAKIWDLESGKNIFTFNEHTDEVTSLAFSPDGKWLATGSQDKTVKIWDLNTGKSIFTLRGHPEKVNSVAFAPDGNRLASCAVDTVKIWNLTTGQNTLNLSSGNKKWVLSVAFSPDGKKLATGAADFTAKIWDLEAGKNELTLSGHFDMVNSVAFSPDGQRLATGSSDQLAKIWDLENGKELLSLFGHSDAVTCVAFSPDGQRLATGSGDQTVKIWELNPDVIIRKTTGNHRLAGLNLGQLIDYDLENLLETHPENEGILRASKAPLQIAAFAELYAQNTLNSSDLRRTLPYFARAARLYRCALDCGADSSLLQSLGNLYFKWAQDILASNRPDTAAAYIERSCQLYADKSECPNLWSLYSEKTGSAFNFQLFLAAEDLSELQGYGAYFFGKKRWNEAKQLYEKAESKQHAPEVLIKLFEISENRRETFNFNRFLASEEVYELYAYGYYFFEKQSWNEAKQLFEKVEASQHSPEALQYLFSIAAFRNEPFDFNRFLASEDVEELRSYGEYFLAHENWTQAKQVYEKAEAEQHTMDALTNLYAVSEKLGETFDFNRFLASEEDNELSYYGDYFLGNEKWAQAAQLYEKAEARQHSPEALKKLFEIAEKTGVAFNFNRFLMAEDPNELSDYAFFLVGKAQKFEKYTDWVPFYQDALLLREKQMKLDTSAAVRADASTEYNSVGYFQLFIPDGKAAEESLRRALELNPENKYIATNLAPALLLQGKYAAAEAEYKKWAPLPFNESGLATYRDGFLDDMKTMEEQGVSGFDYARVRAWLKE